MNHVSDVTRMVRDLLESEPGVYRAVMVQGDPDAERADYPNRDGEWLIYVCMDDMRYFRVQITADETVRELASVDLEEVR